MSTTYLKATNEILKELNEVELSSANFSSAVGIHAFAKDIINRAYFDVINAQEEWPFLIEGVPEEPFMGSLYIETVAGTRFYLIKTASADSRTDFKSIDWDNFYVTNYGVAGATEPYANKKLRYVSTEQYNRYRSEDNETHFKSSGYAEPLRVFRSADNRYFGLSPIPDKVYRIYFNAWTQPARLSLNTDQIVIPDSWINVLYARARYYMWQFKESPQQAAFALQEYNEGLLKMRRNLIDSTPDDMIDSRTRFI